MEKKSSDPPHRAQGALSIAKLIEQLQEEALPGVWSKGVQLSRLKGGIELQKGGNNQELRLKLQTAERVLAFQVTLWPEDGDSYCNCGSKIEPCHHIVAAALAFQNGNADTAQATTRPQLIYRWEVDTDSNQLSLKREFFTGERTLPISPSLISMISGIQSGRLKLPMPPTGSVDLQIDELLLKPNFSWAQLLKVLREIPPLPVVGLPNIEMLEIDPTPLVEQRSELIIEDGENGVTVKTGPRPGVDFTFNSGLGIRDKKLFFLPTDPLHAQFKEEIRPHDFGNFVLEVLPRLRENYSVTVTTRRLPEIVDRDPTLEFKIHPLPDGTLSITPFISYGDIGDHQVLRRDLVQEQQLAQTLRRNHSMILNQPQKLLGDEVFKLRGRFQHPALDHFLTRLIEEVPGLTLDQAMKNPDAILQLLMLKKDSKSRKSIARHLQKTLLIQPEEEAPSVAPPRVSRNLWEKLRDYQKVGVAWLANRMQEDEGAILADDMGLGKTIQTLSVLEKTSLVVAPTSLLYNWKTEATRFRPDLKVHVFHGSERTWDDHADLILTTYGLLRQESDRFSEKNWQTVVLDEAHLIRNSETQIANSAHRLRAGFKLALTGTPIQNKQQDLISLFRFIAPDFLESQTSLQKYWVEAFLLRRTKSQVLTELPPKTYLEHRIEFTPQEREGYQSVWAAAKKEILERLTDQKLNPLTLFEVLLRSRQFCDHPGLIDPARLNEPSSKLTELVDLVEELLEAGHSVLVYSQWTKFLDRIELALEQKSLTWLRLDGSTRDRTGVLERFQNSDRPQIFLLSLHAGGVGLNLTQASHVIFCDPWWNPYVELQAEDRAYRMGQDKPVTIHRLNCTQSIEEKIRALQLEKMQLEKDYLGESATPSFNLADLDLLLK